LRITKQKNITRKRLIVLSIILFCNLLILSLNLIDFSPVDNNNSNVDHKADQASIIIPKDSDTYEDWHYDEQMLTNNDFESGISPWYNDTSNSKEDLSAPYTANEANFDVLGEEGNFTYVTDPPQAGDWTALKNPQYPAFPEWPYDYDNDQFGFDGQGMWARHDWREGPKQAPSVHWVQNRTIDEKMSDYVILYFSL